jgi:hypothetical protein
MRELVETLGKVPTELIKAGAIQPVVGFGCFPFCLAFIQRATTLEMTDPPYWICLAFAVAVGGVGVWAIVQYLLIKQRI